MIRGPVAGRPNRGEAWRGADAAWTVIGLLLAGITVWGGIGILLDLWLDFRWLFLPIGMVAGAAGAIYLTYLRYGRDDQT